MQNYTETTLAAERLVERLKTDNEGNYLKWIYQNKPELLASAILLLEVDLKKAQIAMQAIIEQACLLCPDHDKEKVKKHMCKVFCDVDNLSTEPLTKAMLKQKREQLVQIFSKLHTPYSSC